MTHDISCHDAKTARGASAFFPSDPRQALGAKNAELLAEKTTADKVVTRSLP